jgi:hypothetical protein
VIAAIAKAAIVKSEMQISREEYGMATYPGYRPNADKLDPSRAALQGRRFKALRSEHRLFAEAAWGDPAALSHYGNRSDINKLYNNHYVETKSS